MLGGIWMRVPKQLENRIPTLKIYTEYPRKTSCKAILARLILTPIRYHREPQPNLVGPCASKVHYL